MDTTASLSSTLSSSLPLYTSPEAQSHRSQINVDLTRRISGVGRPCLEIRLTDLSDPFFLWTCSIGEEDYERLRLEQQLVMPFDQFPYKLKELLERSKQPGSPFTATLGTAPEDTRMALFSVCETTSFRQIPHIQLRLSAASEAALKAHVASRMNLYRGEVEGLRSQLSETQRLVNLQQTAFRPPEQQQPHFTPPRPAENFSPLGETIRASNDPLLEQKMRKLEADNERLRAFRSRLETELQELKKTGAISPPNNTDQYKRQLAEKEAAIRQVQLEKEKVKQVYFRPTASSPSCKTKYTPRTRKQRNCAPSTSNSRSFSWKPKKRRRSVRSLKKEWNR